MGRGKNEGVVSPGARPAELMIERKSAAESAQDHTIPLRRIEQHRLHRFSSNSELRKAESGQVLCPNLPKSDQPEFRPNMATKPNVKVPRPTSASRRKLAPEKRNVVKKPSRPGLTGTSKFAVDA